MAKGKYEFRTIKVKPDTYLRLRAYQNAMEMSYFQKGKEVRFSMDDVISALLNLVEISKIEIVKLEKEGAK